MYFLIIIVITFKNLNFIFKLSKKCKVFNLINFTNLHFIMEFNSYLFTKYYFKKELNFILNALLIFKNYFILLEIICSFINIDLYFV